MTTVSERVAEAVRDIKDFPKPGIIFKDITPVVADPQLCRDIVKHMKDKATEFNPTVIAGIESRGFLFGLPLAMEMNLPFVLIRKKGKLPYDTVTHKYDLEYGSAEIEMHTDSISKGDRVLIHDDLLATGGTAVAASELIRSVGADVCAFSFLIELSFLGGKEKLTNYSGNIYNLVAY